LGNKLNEFIMRKLCFLEYIKDDQFKIDRSLSIQLAKGCKKRSSLYYKIQLLDAVENITYYTDSLVSTYNLDIAKGGSNPETAPIFRLVTE